MVPKFIYRWAKSCDYVELGVVMYDAVRHGSSCYSEQQRRAWMPQPKSDDQWIERLAKQRIEVAESDGCLLGFIGVLPDGYIDFAYVRSDYQQQGIFVCLYENIEGYARDQGLSQLTTDASLMAQPAFSKVGFTVLAKETVELRGEKFERFKMTKIL